MTTSAVTIAGVEIEYESIAGNGVPLVLLHEGLGSVALWRDFPRRVAAVTGRRTVVFSREGHGHSTPLRSPRGPDFMHEQATIWLPAVLDALGIRTPTLVGHSDGASIAIIYAGSQVEPVDALVLLAPHVLVEVEALPTMETARAELESGDLAERMAKYHLDPKGTFYGWYDVWSSVEFRDWNIEQYLPAITCPVLLVQCDQDEYGSLVHLDLIEEGVGGPVTRVVLEGCGHSPHLDEPERVVEAIAGFLATGH